MGIIRFSFILLFGLLILSCKGGVGTKIDSRTHAPAPGAVLAEVENLAAPSGVDTRVFGELKRELIRQLELAGTARNTSAAPGQDFAKVMDLAYDPANRELSWTYRNHGDYDLNGETSIADLTEIARHYQALTNDGKGDDAREAWVDGDGSGEVAIPDITPIALNFMGEIQSYRILVSVQSDGDYQETGDPVLFGTAGEFPKRFVFNLPAGAFFYVKVQAVGADGTFGMESDALAIPQPAHVLSVAPLWGAEHKQVYFSAKVAGTGPFTYSWNFGGGAVPNTSTDERPKVTLETYGTYYGVLGCGSDYGGEYFPFTYVVKSGNIAVEIVTPQGGAPGDTVIFKAVVDGDPTLFHWDFGGGAKPYTSLEERPEVTLTSTEGEYNGTLTLYGGLAGPVKYPFSYKIDPVNEHPVFGDYTNRFLNSPMAGQAPLAVTFDFSRATDADGTIAVYLADLNGDGRLDWYGPDNTIAKTYYTSGFRLISGRVMDDKGFVADGERPVVAFDSDPYAGAVPDSLFLLSERSTYNVGDKLHLVYFNLENANPMWVPFFRVNVDRTKALAIRSWAGDIFNGFGPELEYIFPWQWDTFVDDIVLFGPNDESEITGATGVIEIQEFELQAPGPVDFEPIKQDADGKARVAYQDHTLTIVFWGTLGKDYGNGVTAKYTVNVS